MTDFKLTVARTPGIGRAVLTVVRAKTALGYFRRPVAALAWWLYQSRETTNFTYDLEPTNIHYLASMIADVLEIERTAAQGFIDELEHDAALRNHIATLTAQSEMAFLADRDVRFGRRVGWYAFVRALKPRVVVETGVDKGLGACVLTAALKRNAAEGFPGQYFGTDINPRAGYLLAGEYARFGRILYGDSIASLRAMDAPIDLFVNDSDHSADYEAAEYATIATKLSERAIVLGDNAHATDKLYRFSCETGRDFVFFREAPLDHWYPGAGIGISFVRRSRAGAATGSAH